MRVREFMTSDPEWCVGADSCAVAGAIMRRRNCGFVPVVDGPATRRVVGVVTDRDLALHLIEADRPASQVLVGACMTSPVQSIGPDADLEDVAKIMEATAVHRLPVVEEGRLVGVLSLKDIAQLARQQWASSGPHLVERQMTEILEAIAAARATRNGGSSRLSAR